MKDKKFPYRNESTPHDDWISRVLEENSYLIVCECNYTTLCRSLVDAREEIKNAPSYKSPRIFKRVTYNENNKKCLLLREFHNINIRDSFEVCKRKLDIEESRGYNYNIYQEV